MARFLKSFTRIAGLRLVKVVRRSATLLMSGERTPLAYRIIYSLKLRGVYRPLVKLAELVGPGSVGVDVGAGYGLASELIANKVGHLVLVELDRGMAVSAHRRLIKKPNLSVVRANACSLPIADEIADFVVFFDSLHHIAPTGRALEEAVRVLKPGGILAIYDLDGSKLSAKAMRLLERAFGLRSSYMTESELCGRLHDLGVIVISVERGWAGQLNLLALKPPKSS